MSHSLQNLSEKEKELIKVNEKLNENKLKLQNDYVKHIKKNHFYIFFRGRSIAK